MLISNLREYKILEKVIIVITLQSRIVTVIESKDLKGNNFSSIAYTHDIILLENQVPFKMFTKYNILKYLFA